jgi:hypothetical protein
LRLTDHTVGVCFKARSTPANGVSWGLVTKGDDDATDKGNYGLVYVNDSGTLKLRGYFRTSGGTQYTVEGAKSVTVGRYYAAFVTFNNTTKQHTVWVADMGYRGTAGDTSFATVSDVQTGATPDNSNTDPLVLGGVYSATSSALANVGDVDISEVIVDNAAASTGTLEGWLYERRAVGDSLTGYWRCDELTGSTVYDRSGNGNDGTVQNPGASWCDCPADLLYPTGLITEGVLCWHNALWRPEASITASSEAAANPDGNLLHPRQHITWRSSAVGSEVQLVVDCGRPVAVEVLTLDNHNLTSAATITLEGHTADSWGTPDVSETVTFHPSKLRHVLARPLAKRWWRGRLLDTGNGDGYLEAGALGLWAGIFEASLASTATAVTLQDQTRAVRTRHHRETTRSLEQFKTVTINWPLLTRGQARELRRVMREVGRGSYVFACGDPRRRLYERGVYGWVTDPPSETPYDPAWSHSAVGGFQVEPDFP